MAVQKPLVIELTSRGDVTILQMKGEENRINILFCRTWLETLELIEPLPHVKAVVTTGWEKFYSNGLDLEFLSRATSEQCAEFGKVFGQLQRKLITFPVVTIAAINGHCFAGGFLFALLHDYRVMQKGKGWMCMNEIDLGLRIPSMGLSLLKKKLTNEAIRESVVFGRRVVAEEALELGIVDEVCGLGQSVPTAVEMAKNLVKNRTYEKEMVRAMKEDFYSDIFAETTSWKIGDRELSSKL